MEKMYFLFLVAITLVSTIFLSKLLTRGYKTKNLPRGSLGFPLIGETFSFLSALKKDKGAEWINERVFKYGKVFKTSLMGTPTVVLFGQAGNKFVLGSDEGVLATKQPKTLASIAGKYSLFELTGSRYKLIKGAALSFLKSESLQNYVKQMDDLVKNLLLRETKDRDTLATVIFVKKLTFTFSCSILFGIHDDLTIKAFFDDFILAFKHFGVFLYPFPAPFTGMAYKQEPE
ncbi:unnamed protein product [Ilex paraguariensis]|uniref:Uncharacterized protein n=1 Tax=Ilex paraguariensis TaxID=185542 RepID=A0ABC8R8B9_9AQUA